MAHKQKPRWFGKTLVLKLGKRADDGLVALVAFPNRQGRRPKPFARNRPVLVSLEPFAEPAFLQVFRLPIYFSFSLTMVSAISEVLNTTTAWRNKLAGSYSASRTDSVANNRFLIKLAARVQVLNN